MDRKMLTIILAVVLIGCFFLPYAQGNIFGVSYSASGFNMVFPKETGGETWERFIWLVIPASGLLLLLGALNNENYILGRGLLSWLPILALIYTLIVADMVHGRAIGDVFKGLGQGYGIGLWITIGASLVLAVYNPRPKA
jgi:hypothetical protein